MRTGEDQALFQEIRNTAAMVAEVVDDISKKQVVVSVASRELGAHFSKLNGRLLELMVGPQS